MCFFVLHYFLMDNDIYDFLIIGSGAAGLAAALYAGRYRLKTLVSIGPEFGGATAVAGEIWNYPGTLSSDSYALMKDMRKQAEENGAVVQNGYVTGLTRKDDCFFAEIAKTKDKPVERTVMAKSVLLSTGAERKKLGLPKEKELAGKGVHYCVTCDGPVYTGKTIAIVGGGDAAAKGVILSAQYAQKIYLLVRGDKMRAEPTNQDRLKALGEKVEILWQTEIKEIMGEKKLEKLVLTKAYNGSTELAVDGVFVEIGALPAVELGKQVGVALDPLGYVAVDAMMRTNISGFFAAGDTVNIFGAFKQTITSAAMGPVAATSAYDYVQKGGAKLCAAPNPTMVPAQTVRKQEAQLLPW